jgi:hypothetical protein
MALLILIQEGFVGLLAVKKRPFSIF